MDVTDLFREIRIKRIIFLNSLRHASLLKRMLTFLACFQRAPVFEPSGTVTSTPRVVCSWLSFSTPARGINRRTNATDRNALTILNTFTSSYGRSVHIRCYFVGVEAGIRTVMRLGRVCTRPARWWKTHRHLVLTF